MKNLINLDYEIIQIPNHEFIRESMLSDVLQTSATVPLSSRKVTNVGGWQSELKIYDDFENDENPLTHLFKPVLTKFTEYISSMTLRPNVSLNLLFGWWINVNYKNDLNIPHNHLAGTSDSDHTLLSGTYYLQKPQNSGNIVFTNPSSYLKPLFEDDVDTEIDVSEGECVLFPASQEHLVLPNQSSGVRVSIAFNLFNMAVRK